MNINESSLSHTKVGYDTFYNRFLGIWNKLPQEIIDASLVNIYKIQVNRCQKGNTAIYCLQNVIAAYQLLNNNNISTQNTIHHKSYKMLECLIIQVISEAKLKQLAETANAASTHTFVKFGNVRILRDSFLHFLSSLPSVTTRSIR